MGNGCGQGSFLRLPDMKKGRHKRDDPLSFLSGIDSWNSTLVGQ